MFALFLIFILSQISTHVFAENYDEIIIGSGPTACAYLLQSLELDKSKKRLVIERGSRDLEDTKHLSGWPRILNSGAEWTHLAPSQPTIATPKVFGGGSQINAGVLLRADREWTLNALPQVNWSKFLRAYAFVSHKLDLARPSFNDSPIQRHDVVSALRTGLAELGYDSVTSEPSLDVTEIGYYTPISLFDHEGNRRGLASYLSPQQQLTIRTQTLVESIVIVDGRATGVKLDNGEIISLRDDGQIVLSAGAMLSPFLLLKSGVGPKEELAAHGVDVRALNEHVGANLSDHFALALSMHVAENLPLASVPLLVNSDRFAMEFVFGGQLATYFPGLTQTFKPIAFRKKECTEKWFFWQNFLPRQLERIINNQLTFIVINKDSPLNKGRVGLQSVSGVLAPKIDLPALDERVIDDLRTGIEFTKTLVATKSISHLPHSPLFNALQGFGYYGLTRYFEVDPPASAPYNKVLPAPTENIQQFIKDYYFSPFHYTGTLSYGLATDNNFMLRGVKNVVIADASLLKEVTPHNPQLTLMALGAYIAHHLHGLNRPASMKMSARF